MRGFAWVEVLGAFLALSGGLLAVLNFHSAAQNATSEAKAQAEAVALAEDKLQELESFLSSSDTRLDDGTYADTATGTNASFTRSWTVATDGTVATQKNTTVTVGWTDRAGDAQSVVVGSEFFFNDPTEPIENMLAVVDLAKQVSSANIWGTVPDPELVPDPDADPDADPGADPDADPGADPDADPDADPNEPPATYEIVVSSSLTIDPTGGTALTGIIVSAANNTVNCTNSTTSWTCTAPSVPIDTDLDFTVTFTTNNWACVPSNRVSSGFYTFTGLDHDITSGYPVVLKRNSSC
jgi:hypothetical protein